MIGHKLPNKTKSATVAKPKLFHQLNNPFAGNPPNLITQQGNLKFRNWKLKPNIMHRTLHSEMLSTVEKLKAKLSI
jgi:hypothetical protein